jgi:hypothetical protein
VSIDCSIRGKVPKWNIWNFRLKMLNDVEHYKHVFRYQNKLFISKKRKKNSKKIIISSSFENHIVTSKVIRRRQHINIDSKGILKQGRVRGSTKQTRSDGTYLNSSKFSNSPGSGNFFLFLFYLSNLNKLLFRL